MYNILHKVYHSVRSYANRLCEGIMDIIWYIFDMIGTIAFAISGALVGVARKMDIFGMAVLALATAIGSGLVLSLKMSSACNRKLSPKRSLYAPEK